VSIYSTRTFRHLRWWIAAILFASSVINYVDRQTLSVLAPVLRDRFGMSNTDYSHVVFAFLLAYMLGQVGSGRLIDRLGTRFGFTCTMAFWSGAAMLHSLAGSTGALGVCRFLLGLGEAGNWPGAVKAVSEWFPRKERAFATGIANAGSTLGAVLAPPVVAWIALGWGWRAAFLFTGALGFLWLLVWLAWYRLPAEHPRLSLEERRLIEDGEETSSAGVGGQMRWGALLLRRQAWGLILARFFCEPVWWFYVFWLPEYLKRTRGFSLVEIGRFSWIPFLACGVGSFLGGAMSGGLIERGFDTLTGRKIVLVASTVVMLAGLPAVYASTPTGCLALISLTVFAYGCWSPNILALAADMFPSRVVASMCGLAGAAAALGGMLFTLITGAVVDRFSYTPIFVAASLMPLVAAGFVMWGVRPEPAAKS
jgi:MFS transporter, ACS family, hexuronate transporter